MTSSTMRFAPVQPPRRRRKAVAVAVAAAIAVVGTTYWWTQRDTLPQDAAFRLGSRVVTKADVDDYVHLQQALYGIKPPTGSKALHDFRTSAAKSLAVAMIITRAGAAKNIRVAQQQVDEAEKAFLAKAYPAGRESFVEALASEGVNEGQVKDEIRRQLQVKALYDSVVDGVSVSAQEVATAYSRNPAEFQQPEMRRVAEIVVPDEQQARSVLMELRQGNRFADLARSRSLDKATANMGGDLGWVGKKQLQGPFAAAAFTASTGIVFGPVQADGATYQYLGVVTAVRKARPLSLAEVRDQLTQELTAARGLEQWQAFLHAQIVAADVRYAPTYRPEDPDAVPGSAATPAAATTASPSGAP